MSSKSTGSFVYSMLAAGNQYKCVVVVVVLFALLLLHMNSKSLFYNLPLIKMDQKHKENVKTICHSYSV